MASDRCPASTFAAVLLATSLTLGAGCSLAITAPEPERPRDEVPKCDTGKGLVAMDGLWAGVFAASSLAAFSEDSAGTGLALAGVGALFVASAVRGSNTANACRDEFETYNASLRDLQRQELLARDARPSPAVKRAPRKVVSPVPLPPVAVAPEQEVEADEAPEYATPRPPAQQPISPKPTKPAPRPKRPPPVPDEEDWSSFWKELP